MSAESEARGSSERAPRSRWRARLLALGLALVASLALGELYARVAVGAPLAERLPLSRVEGNPHRGWAMLPSEDHYTYQHLATMNALGLRGAEVPETKADGELRVLALGDSLTYGQGVADEHTVPRAMERELAARAPARAWRVVNAGHRGYATNQELGLLRELGPRVAPDVVLLLWYWNDLDLPEVDSIHARLAAQGPVVFDLNAPFEGRAALGWRLKQLLRRSALVMLLHDALRGARAGEPDPGWREAGLARLPGQLEELGRRCEKLGARAAFVALPDAAALRGPHPSAQIAARALELARAAGLPALDLLPEMRARYQDAARLPILPYDGHYDAEANDWMGARIAEWLLSSAGLALGRE